MLSFENKPQSTRKVKLQRLPPQMFPVSKWSLISVKELRNVRLQFLRSLANAKSKWDEILSLYTGNKCSLLLLMHPSSLNSRSKIETLGSFSKGQRRRQQERHKFAYLVGKNNSFARPARAFLIFVHFFAVVSKATTWNYQVWGVMENVSTWR